MLHHGKIAGAPLVAFVDSKANVETQTAERGMFAVATDTGEWGYHDGAGWVWGVQATVEGQNNDSVTIQPGQPVAIDSSGIVRAQADGPATLAAGLALKQIAPLNAGRVVTEGMMTLSDWTDVTGTVTLTRNAWYYLDASTPGRLTTVAPTTAGQYVQRVGRAVSANTLDLALAPSVRL